MRQASLAKPALAPATAPLRGRRDFYLMAGLLVAMLVGFAGLAATVGWDETIAQLKSLTGGQMVILLLLSLTNYTLRGLRWHLFARRLGLPLPLRHNMLHFMGGFAMTITPARLGELVRLRWIGRISGWRLERILPLPVVDRAFDIAALGLVLAGGVMLSQSGGYGAAPVAALAIATAFFITRPQLISAAVTGLWRIVRRWPRRFVALRQAARSMAGFTSPGLALPALGLSILGWCAEGYALFLLLTWFGADISLAAATVIFIFSLLAGGLTGAPGGVGGAEASMLMLLSAHAVPFSIAVPAMAIIRVTSLWFAIAVGLVMFPIAERHAQRALVRRRE